MLFFFAIIEYLIDVSKTPERVLILVLFHLTVSKRLHVLLLRVFLQSFLLLWQ